MSQKELSLKQLERDLRPHFDRLFPVGRGGDKMRLLESTLTTVLDWVKGDEEKEEEKTNGGN